MLIFPAIDLKDGKVVRLHKGRFDTVHQVADDPVETAKTFCAAGARYLPMVDLDGARDGKRKNSAIVQAVAEVGLRIELGGGIRSMADLEAVFSLGVWRGVIGSAAVSDPELSGRPWQNMARSALPWASTPRTAWSAPPAGRKTPGWTIFPLQSKWDQSV